MKRIFIFFVVIVIVVLHSSGLFGNNIFKIKKVVIDAGHGGNDPGCVVNGCYEKTITLSVALKLGKYIEKNFKDVEVIYTRKDDNFVELHQRAEIANQNKADLFISIHCNANPSSTPFGVETYVMGNHRSKANLEVAQKENASILLEDDYLKKYNGFDPNSAEGYIIFSLYQNAFLEQSLTLASKVQKQLKDRVSRYDRGVKQAGFLVLFKTTMPSILIETGFLSNPDEAVFMSSTKGQEYIALAIYRAFKEYKSEVENTSYKKDEVDEIKDLPKINYDSLANEISKNNEKNVVNNDSVKVEINKNPEIKKDTIKPNIKNLPDTIKKNVKKEQPKQVKENKNTTNNNIVKDNSHKENPKTNKIVFKIQLTTSPVKLSKTSEIYKKFPNVYEYYNSGSYKYATGAFKSITETKTLLTEIRNKGYKDAFVVAFNNGERITLEEAKKILQK
ncbi:MAG: N-acetylmuramoyl-L-alanine amidase [Bacteroidales bacterium]